VPLENQCPYNEATKCSMELPCNGCEEWAKAIKENKIKESKSDD